MISKKNEELIKDLMGERPKYFRFPYGYYSEEGVRIIEERGYKIVHWSFESGDPDKSLTKDALIKNVIKRAKAGSILIFHINGRGWKTGEALPEIVDYLIKNGFKFVLLKEVLM